MSDRSQAHDIQLQHRECRVQRAIHECALQSVASVVDQDVDRNASVVDPLMQLDDCRNILQIDLLHDDFDAVPLAQCLGKCFKPVQPARHQNQRMALLGILAGELLAEAARCAGDENPRVVCYGHAFTRAQS
jgi:hypothetical protein